MSYYMGDFYRGDPGAWSWIMGHVVKPAVGMIPGVGPAISAVLPGGAKVAPRAAGEITAAATSAIGKVKGAIVKHPVLSAAGAAGALGTMAGAGAEALMARAGACHPGGRGRVLKKCGQILKSGKCGKCHRRMNPFNPYAARRSARRLHSLVRHYRKYIGFVSAKRPKGRPYVKRGKRK